MVPGAVSFCIIRPRLACTDTAQPAISGTYPAITTSLAVKKTMSNLVKLLYDVAALKAEYQRLHDDLFGLSMRRFWFLVRPGARQSVEKRLQDLLQSLAMRRAEMHQLNADDLSIRRGEEIRMALDDFCLAFTETLERLDKVHQRKTKLEAEPSDETPLAAYDDALQQQRRLGARLNYLIESL